MNGGVHAYDNLIEFFFCTKFWKKKTILFLFNISVPQQNLTRSILYIFSFILRGGGEYRVGSRAEKTGTLVRS